MPFNCRYPGYLTQQERALSFCNWKITLHSAKPFYKLPPMEERIKIMHICLKFPRALRRKAFSLRDMHLKVMNSVIQDYFSHA